MSAANLPVNSPEEAAERRADALADQVHVLQAETNQLRTQLATAQAEVHASLRLAEARRARGRLARIRAAWRGE